MAQLVKSLFCKPEDLSLGPQHLCKSRGQHTLVTTVPKVVVETGLPGAYVASQLNQGASLSHKNLVGGLER